MSKKYLFITAILFILLGAHPNELLSQDSTTIKKARPKAVRFSFSLQTSAQTSAGVYTKDSILVRTLWSGVTYNAGKYTSSWDGTDDNGRLVSDGDYVVKVLSGNVNYTWEGVIGNTSDSLAGDAVHRSFDPISGMAIAGNIAFTCADYSEKKRAQAAFDIRDIQKRINLFPNNGTNQGTHFVATDGANVYWAGYDPFNHYHNFVFASKVTDNSQTIFSSGVPIKMTYGEIYPSAIDYVDNINGAPTGMAVQNVGNYLFVSHGTLNELHVINKNTGILAQTIKITNPRGLAVDSNDNLWVINNVNTVTKYSVNSNGTLSAGISVAGVVAPLALAVSPDNSTLVICDGGDSQQLKAFDNKDGGALWTYGQKGGYMTNANVANDKFYFSDVSGGINRSYIAFQSDGSFWVGDAGNYRNLHFSANREYLNQIMYLPAFYSARVDKNNPNKVFAEYLEFKIDYSKPLAGNNGSWTLVNNWRAVIPVDYSNGDGSLGIDNVLNSVVTLSNGSTYAIAFRHSDNRKVILELPASGKLRFTGADFSGNSSIGIGADGSLNEYKKVNNVNQWLSSPLLGFDASNNPKWGSAVIIATAPGVSTQSWGAIAQCDQTTSGVIVGFDRSKLDYGKGNNFHLGGVKRGDNKWLWRTAKNTSSNYKGEYPKDGAYDIGNGVVNAGGSATVIDNSIFWNYHGEFWKNGQTNEFTHVNTDGLMIGMFGTNSYEVADKDKAPAEMAGNTMSIFSTKDSSGNVYVMGCDESYHGGIQRWRVTNLNTIKEQVIPIQFTAVHGLLGQYYDSTDMNNFNLKRIRIDRQLNLCGTCSNSVVSNYKNFSVKWTGFIKADYNERYNFYVQSTGGVRMWVDGKLIIDQFDNKTANEFTGLDTLSADTLYPVCIEYTNPDLATMQLSWSSASTAKQLVQYNNLFAACKPDTTKGIDLMEGVPHGSALQNGFYGWKRNSTSENYTSSTSNWWSAKTDVKTYSLSSPDLSAEFAQPNGKNYELRRDLGVTDNIDAWKISGKVNFDLSAFNLDNNGVFVDVLDNDDKIISRFYLKRNSASSSAVCQVYGNTQILNSGTDLLTFSHTISNKNQPIEISAANGQITFKYAKFTATDAVYDPSAKWDKPKTLRVYFVNVNDSHGRKISMADMRFLRSYANTTSTAKTSQPVSSTTAQAAQRSLPKNGSPYISTQVATINVYPNPLTGKQLNVRFENVEKGTYQVTVVSTTGQVVMNRMVKHEGSTSVQSFPLSGAIANGQYQLQITGNGIVYSKSFLKL